MKSDDLSEIVDEFRKAEMILARKITEAAVSYLSERGFVVLPSERVNELLERELRLEMLMKETENNSLT